MRILCVFSNEAGYFSPDPSSFFPKHTVTVTNSYDEAAKMLNDEIRGIPPFDVVLSDFILNQSATTCEQIPCAVDMISIIDMKLVKGLGFFLREFSTEGFADDLDGYQAIVASCDCWSFTGQRDWEKLYSIVIEKIDRIHKA